MTVQIRRLVPTDAGQLRELRLRALTEHPTAFAEDPRDAAERTVEWHAERLAQPNDDFVLGAFDDDRLIGMVGFHRETGLRVRHKGLIWGVYVCREYGGRSIGRQLMTQLLDMARALPGLEQVQLALLAGNDKVRKLYDSLGFISYGVEPRALKIDGHFTDDELMVLFL